MSHSPLVPMRAGLIEYNQALALQRSLHSEVVSGHRQNTLLLLEHPSVFTAGKRTLASEKPQDGTPVIDVDRGGKITWHGPGQLVGYPIVKLAKPTELVGFVREIESGLIAVCGELGLQTSRVNGRSGVWVRDNRGDRKIAAIGIRVASGVSMHGFAINVNPDLSYFNRIVACGINDASVSSLAVELNRSVTVDEIFPIVEKHLSEVLMKVSA
ncbi:MAG: lipoyl(octanoyl) transferase LipB [Actinobacteria bacterium]|nr:lipoyl(octanoyl) transferase LipB [Actinomycetota bacterium]